MTFRLCCLNVVFLALLLAACGGLNRNVELQPLAPHVTDSSASVIKERGGSWKLDLDGAELWIWPVRLSSRTTWVFGPFIAFPTLGLADEVREEGLLEIGFIIDVQAQEDLSFDPHEFTIVLIDGSRLQPTAMTQVRGMGIEKAKPVEYTGGKYRLWLQYDVPVDDLEPFSLRLGTLDVSGRSVDVPPISFVKRRSYSGS